MSAPEDTVEVTCSREVCHVVYAVDKNKAALVVGATCPDCKAGVLVLIEQVAPDGCDDPNPPLRGSFPREA